MPTATPRFFLRGNIHYRRMKLNINHIRPGSLSHLSVTNHQNTIVAQGAKSIEQVEFVDQEVPFGAAFPFIPLYSRITSISA